MLGTTLSHYEIRETLGEGGMGVVYRARDTDLGRDVAVKLLRSDVAPDSERRRRFEQEARAASALNHPNIVTIYEIGEHAGARYLAMEFVEGRTLRSLLEDGPMPASQILELARQIAEGLAKAHAAGIVHRDLKPENIMVSTDGYVKILDFGLAKLWPEPERATVDPEMPTLQRFETGKGILLGTPAYMSPEQARGLPVDSRSDLFSFGAILYEMATGENPFARPSAAETLAAVLEAKPSFAPLERASVPLRLKGVVQRCLSKSPDERHDTTRELAEALRAESAPMEPSPSRRQRRLGLGALVGIGALVLLVAILLWWRGQESRTHEIRSIAVLPLENLSGDPEQEYFADGMTEALITELSRIGALRVISRTSAMRYRDTDKSLPEIASELHVDAVVEGSVMRVGDRVRVATQLIDAATDRNLWAESYDRELKDVLALHSDVARAVAREIEVALTPGESSRMSENKTVRPEAYQAYLRGRYHLNKFAPDEVEEAISHFESALAMEPRYAAAYAGLADCYNWLGTAFLGEPPASSRLKAVEAANHALEIDPNLAEAYGALGWAEFTGGDARGAKRAFERALVLNPSSSEAHRLYAYLFASQEKFDEAIGQARMATDLDPVSVFTQTALGHVLLVAGRYDEGLRELDKALELGPRFIFAHVLRGVAYLHKAMFAEAVSAFQSIPTAPGESTAPAIAGLGCAYVGTGRTSEARELLHTLLARSAERYVPQAPIAWLYSCLGEDDEAVARLERAAEEGSGSLNVVLRTWWPESHPLRHDPRVRDLLRRIGQD
jgi:serine/threonine protein kinase/tetratricopeptide (TPR) repeat protein